MKREKENIGMIRTNTETKTETEKESAMLIELTEEELESMCGGTDFPHGVYVHVDVDVYVPLPYAG